MSERRVSLFSKRIWISAAALLALALYFAYSKGMLVGEIGPTGSVISQAPQSTGGNEDQGPVQLGPSGLKIPRFVSLKSDRVNVRRGPSQDHAIAWVFRRQGLPVEIIAEFENWRQIRDSEGTEGWVIQSLLSGRRTVLVAPWANAPETIFELRKSPDDEGELVARVEQKLLANLLECQDNWCRISVQEIEGWLPQNLLWGVGPKEVLN